MVQSRFTHRNVSLRQLIAAIGNDGYSQATGELVKTRPDGVTACAIGQGALNLGVDEHSLDEALGGITIGYGQTNIRNRIVSMNDSEKASCKRIAAALSSLLTEAQKDQTVRVKRKDWSATPGYRGVTVPRGALVARS